MRAPTLRLGAAGAGLLAALLLAGCGGGGGGGGGEKHPAASPTAAPAAAGARVFASAGCATCHTLAAAHATGQVGPNLDRLAPSVATVRHQVEHGGGGMPSFKGRLTPAQIDAVARYVARSAGRGGH